MIRAVIDTNVIISGTFWNGVPRQILKASNQGTFTLISSMALLNELERVLNYDKFAGFFAAWDESPAVIIRRYQQMIEVVESIHLPDDAVRDPKDVMVLEAALGGKALSVVTPTCSRLLKLMKVSTLLPRCVFLKFWVKHHPRKVKWSCHD